MALLDLSLVTTALLKLLADNINKVIDTNAGVTVTSESPDSVGTVLKTLSLYMYHLGEEAQYKNIVGAGNDPRNIARAPMGLCLYYVLTAHHTGTEPGNDALVQQKLMGYALKTLHDYPLVFDGTKIDGQSILSTLVGSDNPLQIILRPVAPEESVSFWSAEDSKTARLSAYYEVRVILLEPEEPTSVPAPVLNLGTYLYQLGATHLDCTRSELAFDLPAGAGGDTQTLTVSPARACVVASHNRLTLLGTNLTLGMSRQLWLRTPRWTAIGSPAGTGGPIPIDLSITDNQIAGWALSVQPDQLILDIGAALTFVNDLADETPIAVFPGIYTAFLRVVINERIVYGQVEAFTVDSNEVPLVIIPRITGAVPNEPDNRITLTLVEFTVDFGDGTVNELDIQLIVDGKAYRRENFDLNVEEDPEFDPAVNDGLFETDSSTTLTFQALFDVGVAGEHPCRVIVNGAESAPFWIEIT